MVEHSRFNCARLCSLILGLAVPFLCGCTHDFFFPTRRLYRRPETLGITSEWFKFPSKDGTAITGLLMKTSQPKAKGILIQFHGNGENMTSHFMFSYWLPAQGYDVLIFDYRGYGASAGKPSVKGAIKDGEAAIDYVLKRRDLPSAVFIWGQSGGGASSIASLALGRFQNPRIKALLIENSFDSYQDMAEAVLGRSWVTWLLKWPLSRLFISDRYAPLRYARQLPHIPILVIASTKDTIVPFPLEKKLFEELPQPKTLWIVSGGDHLSAFTRFGDSFKPKLLEFLSQHRH